MGSTRNLRKSILGMAMGACLASLALAPAHAQSATGSVAGRASAGDQITLVNSATGASRTVTVGADGSYRLSQLPVGEYSLQVTRAGQGVGQALQVSVPLGGTATINLGSEGGVANLDAVQVLGSRVVNRVDVYSTETATNVSREELARLPVDQSLSAVALLAPGVIGNNRLGGLNFNGSSMAENVVYINGMNVTDPFYRSGFSSVPFAFYQEFQVKTGGYSAEFGRSTGGVINAVTRSGGNEFRGGVEVTMEPSAWQEPAKDRYHEDGTLHTSPGEYGLQSRDGYSWYKANVWASGPIVKDRLFLFGMYEERSNSSHGYSLTSASRGESGNGFWGAKLDWMITDDHKLELLAFSDKADSTRDQFAYTWATDTRAALNGVSLADSGGDNYSLTYTGHFGEQVTVKAMYGVNNRNSFTRTSLDGQCSPVTADASYSAIANTLGARLGCHPTNGTISKRDDEREMGRLDFEWALGNHLLRFGYDREQMTSNSLLFYPGDGFSYQAVAVSPGSPLANGATVPAGVNAIITKRYRYQGGTFETEASAFYLEDNWNVTPNLLLSLGMRVDSFDNKTASGQSFIKLDNLVAPRLGFSWDMKGDGTSKLFGNAGRYFLPVTNAVNEYAGSDVYDEYTYFALQGWSNQTNPLTGSPYVLPVLGAQIGGVYSQNNVGDPRSKVDRDIKAVYQDEFILGYQNALNATWSWGVNATYRIMERTLDDVGVRVPASVCSSGFDYPMLNPGEMATLWCSASQSWVTFDTATEGWVKQGSNEVVGFFKPKREYKGVEFQLDRAWDEKWSFNASYILSWSEGNFEGPVNSDTGLPWTGFTQHYDNPANNERYGSLYGDHRHQLKLRGAYALNDMWSFGATLSAVSGGPITAFGVSWPNDRRVQSTSETSGGGTGWICVSNCGSVPNRVLEYTERGAFGRLPWLYNLGASVTWTLPVETIDLKVRLSVYNVLNRQTVTDVHSRYEVSPGVYRTTFGQGVAWQDPRYMNLVVTYTF